MKQSIRKLFAEIGAIGGKAARGEKKRRSKKHYQRMQVLSVLARRKKKNRSVAGGILTQRKAKRGKR